MLKAQPCFSILKLNFGICTVPKILVKCNCRPQAVPLVLKSVKNLRSSLSKVRLKQLLLRRTSPPIDNVQNHIFCMLAVDMGAAAAGADQEPCRIRAHRVGLQVVLTCAAGNQ